MSEGGESPKILAQGEDEDWNVDLERGDHESDEHWELRRAFMVKNKGSFPKLRLLSLSQVFSNMEFLGCKYPEKTMELVQELSVGVIEEYRQNRKGRLQRTFVKASDAAEKKSKGTKRHSNSFNPTVQENKMFKSDSDTPNAYLSNFTRSSTTLTLPTSITDRERQLYDEEHKKYNDVLKGLVLVDQLYVENEGPLQLLNRSCSMSHKELGFKYESAADGTTICTIKIGSQVIADGTGFSKETSRLAAGTTAVGKLRELCYTIEVKAIIVSGTEVGKCDISNVKPGADAIQEDNVGSKLLKLMGWGGGGLGKNQQGIEAPISTPEVVERSRLGLGLSSIEADFAGVIKKFLQKQMWQCAQFDLKFSPEFNSDERKIIHQIASRLGLRSKSYGKGENRFLVISRKVQLTDLVQEILRTGETAKYRVIEPELLSHRGPPRPLS